jgi:two-component system sensor histidine kinase ChvG
MSVEAHGESELAVEPDEPSRPRVGPLARVMARLRRLWRSVVSRYSSSLTRRIVVLNVGGLVVLSAAFLYLNQFREGLIDARVQSLQTQSEIIAAAIAASAAVETDAITIDPEKLLKLAPGEVYDPDADSENDLEFSINPERVGPVLRRLVSPTRTRARVYDRDGYLLVDSLSIAERSNIMSFELPAPDKEESSPTLVARTWNLLRGRFGTNAPTSVTDEVGVGNGRAFPEVREALGGAPSSVVRVNAKGETIVSVAVPVQRFHVVRGALLLSTQGGDIDKIITFERWAIIRIFLVSAGVMFLLSMFLAGTIAEPMRKLAEAAERVRRGVKSRQEIPDFTARNDEIGHLSGALRDMTGALYARIEAIESFAADVAHELKNPLTSLRSAVETLPRARNDESRGRLLEIIQHDVRRLDRLISDISDASRLDAELARGDMQGVDLRQLLGAVITMANQVERGDGVRVTLDVAPVSDPAGYVVLGHDSRLAQVVNNLVDNARSFSPEGGNVRVALRRARGADRAGQSIEGVEIVVDDDGPGIPAHAFERIFERFYTDRPDQGFGQNSGLGLSISRQIVEAHRGTIRALNRGDQREGAGGARFIVWLPGAA